MTNAKDKIIPPHGGYRNLKSYQATTLIYDFTAEFCRRYIDTAYGTNKTYWNRPADQMVQAARSGRQNIAEGSQVSGTSKKSELKLVGVARGSLEELLTDYEDFLRQRKFVQWGKDSPEASTVRALAYRKDKSYESYGTYLGSPEGAANMMICLIHQANYLLDRQLQSLEKQFLEEGGFTERLYNARRAHRSY